MKLTAKHQPLVSRNMSRNELIRAAEHAFPYPTPIIALMLAHLRASEYVGASTAPPDNGLHCPACGAELHINEDTTA